MLSRAEFVALFEIQTRGTIATAFAYSGVKPNDEHWKLMRGKKQTTMRDLAEIGHLTGHNMHLQLARNSHLEGGGHVITEELDFGRDG